MRVLLVILGLMCMPAAAQAVRQSDIENMSDAAKQAEYHRLRMEMKRYAQRQIWAAVDKGYLGMVALGVPMSEEDHLLGAHAVRDTGNVAEVRQRLMGAYQVAPGNEEVVEWLYAIDSTHSVVRIRAYVGAELIPGYRPFDPAQAAEIDFAIKTLAETGQFVGMLPRGGYRVDYTPFALRAGKQLDEVVIPNPNPTVDAKGPKKRKKKSKR